MNPPMMFLLESVPAGRVFAIDQQTFISMGIQLFNAAFLAFVLAKLLYNPVRNFMRMRTERVAGQIIFAREEMEKALKLKDEYERRLNDIALERDEILSDARKLALEKGKQLLAEAKNEAEMVKARAAQDIQMEQERIVDDMRKTIVDVSSVMAAKLIEQYIDRETHDKMLSAAIADLEDLSWPN